MVDFKKLLEKRHSECNSKVEITSMVEKTNEVKDSENEMVNGFRLSDEQQAAIDGIRKFIKQKFDIKDFECNLTGYAGTGKTSITKLIIEYLKSNGIRFAACAPTHKAKYVLSNMSGTDAQTLHGFLGLSPNLDVESLDMKKLEFKLNLENLKNAPLFGVILVDECSMVGKNMYKMLKKAAIRFEAKIITIGDEAQIMPVNDLDVSETFNVKRRFVLTKEFRQDSESALIPVLRKLREKCLRDFSTNIAEHGSIIVHNEPVSFVRESVKRYREAVDMADPDHCKIIVYRNARVVQFNELVRKCIFKNENKTYCNGEFLMGYDNFTFNDKQYFNSSDYIICEEPKQIMLTIPELNINVMAWKLCLIDVVEKDSNLINVIDTKSLDSQVKAMWAEGAERLRLEAIRMAKEDKDNTGWIKYFNCINCAAINSDLVYENRVIKKKTFDYGYAISGHKSQGSTYEHGFVDMSDLFADRDELELRQLQYVAMSRTKNDCHLLI